MILLLGFASCLNWNAKLSIWDNSDRGREGPKNVFLNQALNTVYNYGCRSFESSEKFLFPEYQTATLPKIIGEVSGSHAPAWEPSADAPASRDAGASQTVFPRGSWERDLREQVRCQECNQISEPSDLWITDPPYADAVHYHEITEYFIAWLRKNPPAPFNEWIWDSRRALAIKGSGDDFRRTQLCWGRWSFKNTHRLVLTKRDAGASSTAFPRVAWERDNRRKIYEYSTHRHRS